MNKLTKERNSIILFVIEQLRKDKNIMEDKFYTIDKIAELLGMHHKPTR